MITPFFLSYTPPAAVQRPKFGVSCAVVFHFCDEEAHELTATIGCQHFGLLLETCGCCSCPVSRKKFRKALSLSPRLCLERAGTDQHTGIPQSAGRGPTSGWS